MKNTFDPKKLINKKDLKDIYQIHIENENNAKITNLGKYKKNPLIVITKFKYINYDCEIVSNLLEKDEIFTSEYLRMVSILFFIDNFIIYSLNFCFYPNNKIVEIKNDNLIEGKFCINLQYKKNKKEYIEIIENNISITEKDKIISQLISVIDNNKIDDKIFKTN
jgi:hypothetical protein